MTRYCHTVMYENQRTNANHALRPVLHVSLLVDAHETLYRSLSLVDFRGGIYNWGPTDGRPYCDEVRGALRQSFSV